MERPTFIKEFTSVSDSNLDERLRVFRCRFSEKQEEPGMIVDAYAILSERYVLICDTMICPEDMEALFFTLKSTLDGRQLLIINSHADWDHCWGNNYFSETTPIISHTLCRERLLATEAVDRLSKSQFDSTHFDQVRLRPPSMTFSEHFTVYGGDVTLELFPAPGHTPDHIAAWLPELRVLLAFDAAEWPCPWLSEPETIPTMRATLKRMEALHPQYVLCSHGQTTSPDILGENLHYLDEIEWRCRDILAQRTLNEEELAGDTARLIAYPLEDAVTIGQKTFDPSYRDVHKENIRTIFKWLLRS